MPDEHARLSPSAASRWISCPASVRLLEGLEQAPSSPYAAEGTKAHALAELSGRLLFQGLPPETYHRQYLQWEAMDPILSSYDLAEMKHHVAGWLNLLKSRVEQHPQTQVLLEQRVQTGLPQCWGTADAILVAPGYLEILDLKYGSGVYVEAVENPQLMLYGVGALDYCDVMGEVDEVSMTIYQPRAGDGKPRTYTMPAADLRAWRDGLTGTAHEALHSQQPSFGPSDKACRWCPVAGNCRARTEKMLAEDFGTAPDLLSDEELSQLLHRLPDIERWCNATRDYALTRAYYGGVAIDGWKVVRGKGRRTFVDDALAIQRLIDEGYKPEQVARFTTRPLGDLEHLPGMSAKRLQEVLGNLLVKSPGNPALVPEDDKREAISPVTEARKDFRNDIEE